MNCSNCVYPNSLHCYFGCARTESDYRQQSIGHWPRPTTYTPIVNPVQTNDVYVQSGVTLNGEMLYRRVK